MKYKKLIFIILIAIMSINLAGCNADLDALGLKEIDEEEDVGYLIVESGQVVLPLTPFNTLNPIMTSNKSYHYFSKLIFEGLFEFDNNLEPNPRLASTYTIKNEGRTISIKLREDVYWHDGEKLTTSDILFTINVLKNSPPETIYNTMIKNALGNLESGNSSKILDAKVLDEYNIEINFDKGYSNNLEILTFPIIPKHAFNSAGGNVGYADALKLDNYTPIGTGPYKFVDYDKYKSISLEANENYREGNPSIGSIMGMVLKNEELFLTAFEAGQINITPALGVDWDKYKHNARIRTLEYMSSNYEFIGFNFGKDIFLGDKGVAIRKAINYGIDRQEIIKKIHLGHATQVDIPLNPDSWLISQEANLYGYNVENSKQILKTAGFNDNDGDGFLEDEEGNKLVFNLITNPSNLYRFRTAEMIKEDLKVIGIELTLDFDTSYKENITKEDITSEWEGLNSRLVSGNFDIALLGWQMSVIPDLSFIYHSSQIGSNNFIKYSNESMDSLLSKANDSYQREDKVLAYQELQVFLVDNLPYVSLFYNNKALLVDAKIMGDLSPTFFNPYYGLEKCFIAIESE